MRQVPRGGHLAVRLKPRSYIAPGSADVRARHDSRWLFDPNTQQCVSLVLPGGGWDVNSFAYGLSPPVVTGDLLIAPLFSNEGYPLVLGDDGVPEVDTGGDTSRQTMFIDIYDVSGGSFYGGSVQAVNDLGPTFSAADKNPLFTFAVGVATQTTDLSLLFPDPEGDAITVTFDPAYTVPSGMTIDISNKINFNSSVRQILHVPVVGADPYGLSDTGTIDLIFGQVDIPDVTGQTTGAADAVLANAYLNQVQGVGQYSSSVLSGYIISQSPTGLADPGTDITTIPSLGTGVYLTQTEAADALSAAATTPASLTLNRTEANDTVAAAGVEPVVAALTRTEANDAVSAAGVEPVAAVLTKTEAADTFVGTATAPSGAALTKTEANDALAATGVETVAGAMSVTESADTFSAAGVEPVAASTSLTEAADTMVAAATTPIGAALTRTEANEALTSAASTAVVGVASFTESPDQLTAASGVPLNAAAAMTEAGDGLSAATSDPIAAASSITEAADTFTATAAEPIAAAFAKTEAADTVTSAGAAQTQGALAKSEAADTLSATAIETIKANLGLTEALDTSRGGELITYILPGSSGLTFGVHPTVNVTAYGVALPVGSTTPTAAQVVAGHNASDAPAIEAESVSAAANADTNLVFSNLLYPKHNVYIVTKDAGNVLSDVSVFSEQTKSPPAGRQYIEVQL